MTENSGRRRFNSYMVPEECFRLRICLGFIQKNELHSSRCSRQTENTYFNCWSHNVKTQQHFRNVYYHNTEPAPFALDESRPKLMARDNQNIIMREHNITLITV